VITVIGTSPDRADWAADALRAVPGDALVVAVPGYELGKLQWVVENTRLERFLFIQDSVIVSEALYALLSDFDGSVAFLSDPRLFGCYLGVYERKILEKVGFPNICSKREAVEAEIWWTEAYCREAGEVPVLFPELTDRNAKRHAMRHGRENLVLENQFVTKYKGTWRHDQIVD
jgi:hypothetical protein